MTHFTGSKYDPDLDITEIAKRIRAEIKAAVAAGHLPKDLKTSVTIERYSGGQSLDVTVKRLGNSYALNPARVKWDHDHPHDYPDNAPARYTAIAVKVIGRLETIMNGYNYDKSDSQSDYFNVNFYGDVKVGWEIERAERVAIMAGESFEDLSIKAESEILDAVHEVLAAAMATGGNAMPPADDRPLAKVIPLFGPRRPRETT